MKKNPYHDFVFDTDNREFVGRFEDMYRQENEKYFDSWFQEDSRHLGRKIQSAILSQYNFNDILDMGCGKASLTHTLQKRNNRVTGIDISETCIKVAAGKYPDVNFICCTVDEYFSGSEKKHDLVIASDILSYLQNWRSVIKTVSERSEFFMISLFIPENPIGFIKSFPELFSEIEKYFSIENKVFWTGQDCIIFCRVLSK